MRGTAASEAVAFLRCGLRRGFLLLFAVASFLFAATSFAAFDTSYRSFTGINASSFDVLNLPAGLSEQEVLENINNTARRNQINLYRFSLAGTDEALTVFGFIGDPAANPTDPQGKKLWSFNPAYSYVLKPYKEFNEYTLLGKYISNADPAAALQVAADLKEAGFKVKYTTGEADLSYYSSTMMYVNIFYEGSAVLIVAFFSLLVASAHYGSRRYRECSLRQVSGHSFFRSILYEASSASSWYLGVSLVWVAVGLPLLYWYNQFAELVTFASVFFRLNALGLGVVLLGQLLAFLVLALKSMASIINGYRPATLIITLALVLQPVALFSFTSAVSESSGYVREVNRHLSEGDKWAEARDYVSVRMVGIDDPGAELAGKLYALMIREDEAGRLLLSAYDYSIPQRLERIREGGTAVSFMSGEIKDMPLVINSLYLRAQVVTDAEGKRVENLPEEDGQVYALVTDAYPFSEEEIVQGVSDWAGSGRSRITYLEHLSAGKSHEEAEAMSKEVSAVKVSVIRLASGQDFFTYDLPDRMTSMHKLYPSPKMLVFAPAKARVLGDYQYSNYTSMSEVFFTDPIRVKAYFAANGLGRVYNLTYPAGKVMLQAQQKWISSITFQVSVMFLALVLLFLSGGLIARIYSELHARRHFVERVNGCGFWRMHWAYLSFSAALFFLVASVKIRLLKFQLFWEPERFYFFPVWLCGLYVLFLAGMLRLYQRRLTAKVLAES